MSDERLRELERRVVGRELLRALERLGDAERAERELARLARGGEPDARRAHERLLAPRPSLSTIGARRGVADVTRIRISRADLEAPGGWLLHCADEERLFVQVGARALALDARSFDEQWTGRFHSQLIALEESVLLWWSGRLQSLDPRTGIVRASHQPEERLVAVTGAGDVAVAIQGRAGSGRLLGLEAGSLRVSWSRLRVDVPWHVEAAAGRIAFFGAVALESTRTLDVLDLQTGHTVFTREFPGEDAGWIGMDAAGVVVRLGDRYVEFDLETGADRRYDASLERCDEARLGERCLVLVRTGEVEAVSRLTGRSLWRAPVSDVERGETAVAGDHVWCLRPGRGSGAVSLTVLELANGLAVLEKTFPLREGEPERPRIVPLDGAVVLLAGVGDALALVRIEDALESTLPRDE